MVISNQCSWLLANTLIACSSALLSALLDKHEAEGNFKALARFKEISPAAQWRIHFLEHCVSCVMHDPIDVEALLVNIFLL